MSISDELRNLLRSQGADMVGVGDLRSISPDLRYDLPFGISIAVALNPKIVSGILSGPTKEYHAEYERANRLLDSLSHSAVQFLAEKGHRTKWLAVTSVGIDPVTLTTQLPHKTTATRAGIGWIGKTALLVTKQFGSAVRLTTVLTDAELSADTPINSSMCGKCTSCVDACPGHASFGELWHVNLYRDSFFDALACRQTAFKLALENVGIRETLCGICIAACPWTRKYIERTA
jgi:epoxyqueuosine reductase